MDVRFCHEKILIVIALTLCASILFYNAFFIPQTSMPTVIYIEKEADSQDVSEESQEKVLEEEDILEKNEENVDISEETENHSENDSYQENNSDNAQANEQKININTATVEEMADRLTGIGIAIAQKIVDYRNSNGLFASIEDIKNVSGIGEKKFEKIKDDICV